MKLLVTNDDGIKSVFFHALVHALKAAGHEPLDDLAPGRVGEGVEHLVELSQTLRHRPKY